MPNCTLYCVIIHLMEVLNLIILIIALVLVLAILIFLYVYKPRKKRESELKDVEARQEKTKIPSFAKLVDIIKTKTTTNSELHNAVELILEYYGDIKPKHGVAPNKDFKRYAEVIFAVTTHPNTDKNLVLQLDRELSKKNPTYKREIDEMLNRGLTARG